MYYNEVTVVLQKHSNCESLSLGLNGFLDSNLSREQTLADFICRLFVLLLMEEFGN